MNTTAPAALSPVRLVPETPLPASRGGGRGPKHPVTDHTKAWLNRELHRAATVTGEGMEK